MSNLSDRVVAVAEGLIRPATMHFSIAGETSTLCGKGHKAGQLNEFLGLLGKHNSVHGYNGNRGGRAYFEGAGQFYSDADSLLRWGVPGSLAGHPSHKSTSKLSLCPICCKAWTTRKAENAAAILANSPDAPGRTRVRRKIYLPDVKNGLLPLEPKAPGTELLPGHFDEDSKGGGCGGGAGELLTTYLPWVSCSSCLVMTDWVVEERIYFLHGRYLVRSPTWAEGTEEVLYAAVNHPTKSPRWLLASLDEWLKGKKDREWLRARSQYSPSPAEPPIVLPNPAR